MKEAGPKTNLVASNLGELQITKEPRLKVGSCTYCNGPHDHVYEVSGGALKYRMCESHLREFVRQANALLGDANDT